LNQKALIPFPNRYAAKLPSVTDKIKRKKKEREKERKKERNRAKGFTLWKIKKERKSALFIIPDQR